MVLGKREMSAVHLVEAERSIGGNVNWVSTLGHSDGKENIFRGTARGLGDWQRVVNYRQIQLDKLKNVEIHTGSRLDAQQIREYGAEIVVVATGCHWATDGLNSATHDTIPGADATLAVAGDAEGSGSRHEGDRSPRAGPRQRGVLHGRDDRPEARW